MADWSYPAGDLVAWGRYRCGCSWCIVGGDVWHRPCQTGGCENFPVERPGGVGGSSADSSLDDGGGGQRRDWSAGYSELELLSLQPAEWTRVVDAEVHLEQGT